MSYLNWLIEKQHVSATDDEIRTFFISRARADLSQDLIDGMIEQALERHNHNQSL